MIPLYKPYIPEEISEINSILQSGHLAYGKWGKIFEESLARYIGIERFMTTNNFSSAIWIILSSLGLKRNDEVIASPMSCLASNQPLLTYGLKIVWADIDPSTGTLDPESVRALITSKTKLIFHNHFCGYPGDIMAINNIASEFGIPVIDDCVEAFGAEYNGVKVGNTGTTATVFSFQTVRLPNTIDGGGITFYDQNLYNKAILHRDYGIDRRVFRDDLNEISKSCDITLQGYGATLNELNSYLGVKQVSIVDSLLTIQRSNGNWWDKKLETLFTRLKIQTNVNPNYWVYGILSNNKRSDIINFRKEGFYASGVHLPNNYYSVFGERVFLKGVEEFYNKFIALPCGWWINYRNYEI